MQTPYMQSINDHELITSPYTSAHPGNCFILVIGIWLERKKKEPVLVKTLDSREDELI